MLENPRSPRARAVAKLAKKPARAESGMFLLEAHRLQGRAKAGVVGRKLNPMRLFHFSITYVSLLFVALAIDPFVRF